jgi:hypothetical protein
MKEFNIVDKISWALSIALIASICYLGFKFVSGDFKGYFSVSIEKCGDSQFQIVCDDSNTIIRDK